MGLYGVVVVTAPGAAYPSSNGQPRTAAASSFDDQLALVLSEIDPVQNTAVDAAVRTAGFSETRPWSGLAPNGCGYPGAAGSPNSTYHTCYPPAVNYSPRYYLVNGVSFDRTNVAGATLRVLGATAGTAASSNNLLLRLVNAGLAHARPGGGQQDMTLIAEDGNPLPGTRAFRTRCSCPRARPTTSWCSPRRLRRAPTIRLPRVLRSAAQPIDQQSARRRHADLHRRRGWCGIRCWHTGWLADEP